jgi:hypothetical protein
MAPQKILSEYMEYTVNAEKSRMGSTGDPRGWRGGGTVALTGGAARERRVDRAGG